MHTPWLLIICVSLVSTLSRYVFRCAIVFGNFMLNIKLYGLYPVLMLFVFETINFRFGTSPYINVVMVSCSTLY
jgi:hypothetical protein